MDLVPAKLRGNTIAVTWMFALGRRHTLRRNLEKVPLTDFADRLLLGSSGHSSGAFSYRGSASPSSIQGCFAFV
jgi:hypothetical protein